MKAAVFHASDRPLVVEEIADPVPGPRDLVVEVRACGICGTDLHAASQPGGLPTGCVMGHEFSGVVVETGGEAASDFSTGDRVIAVPSIGCGTCPACLSGDVMHCPQVKIIGLGQLPGAYARYVRVGSNETLALPDALDFSQGALAEPLAVGLHAVNVSGLSPGQNVFVAGAGPIGLAVTLWARFIGAENIIVSEPAEGRRALAAQVGATRVVSGSESAAPLLAELPGGGADVLFECVGVPGLLTECVGLAPPRSKVVVAGVSMHPEPFVPGLAVVKELELQFVLAYMKSDFEQALDMMAAGRVDPRPMVTGRVDLDGLPTAFEGLKQPSSQCKILVEP